VSDLLWWTLQPSSLALVLLVLTWFAAVGGARRLAAGLAGLLFIAWGAVVLVPVAAWLAEPLEARHPLPQALPEQVDGIVVLGGAVDWRASRARGQLELGTSGERVLAGAALARRYPAARLVLTGVDGAALAHDFVAGPDAASLLFDPAFAARRPLLIPSAGSTYEEALLLLERMQPRPGETWLLVTSAWHMPRAWATFRTLGWTTVAYPVDSIAAGAHWGWPTLPGAGERLAELDRIVREWGAVQVYRRTGRISPEVW